MSVFEGLDGLRPGMAGGEKQAWNNAHAELILMIYEALGAEGVQEQFYIKPSNVPGVISRLEKNHKPNRRSITTADRAFNLALNADGKGNLALREMMVMGKVNTAMQDEVISIKDNLSRYFRLMEQVSGMMADLCQVSTSAGVKPPSNLTYHIGSADKAKVGLTTPGSRVRLSHFHGTARKRLTVPKSKRSLKHHHVRRTRKGRAGGGDV